MEDGYFVLLKSCSACTRSPRARHGAAGRVPGPRRRHCPARRRPRHRLVITITHTAAVLAIGAAVLAAGKQRVPAEALAELDRAAARYAAGGGHPAVALACYERGETHRLRGEYDAADADFDEAAAHGHHAQPGRALLWLEQGRVQQAAAASRRLLAEVASPVHRSGLLPAVVEVFVAADDVEAGAAAARELAELAGSFGCSALLAAAGGASARVALARCDGAGALSTARASLAGWARLEAPYEAARCRVLLGRALRLMGDEASAVGELTEARRTFADLGAVPAEREVAELLGQAAPGGLSPREVEVLRQVAAGLSNSDIAAELSLSEKTVARHLSNIFAKLDVGSRTAAAAFAYQHRLV